MYVGLFLVNAIIDWNKNPCGITPITALWYVLHTCNCYFLKQKHITNMKSSVTVGAFWGN